MIQELEKTILEITEKKEKEQSFLGFLLKLKLNKQFDRWVQISAKNNIPPFIKELANFSANYKNITYGEALLDLRIEYITKQINKLNRQLDSKVTLFHKLNGNSNQSTEATKHTEVVEEIKEPVKETNGLENCPILAAIGSPLTLNEGKANIKKIIVYIHPDKQPEHKKADFEAVYAKVTELETQLEQNWSLFDPLANQSQEHIERMMQIDSNLAKFNFPERVLNS
ncbi:MAG: hypothetical protein QNJ41_17970 [Xenococcaceae cyanobacterium MO_188.B32]|nr:hypothetical protein [Xenococcaceae cyanobacterium MO_188.B32]